ncbi:MAG: GNAT family N-acetyltransferase [Pseudomonadales bacterium]
MRLRFEINPRDRPSIEAITRSTGFFSEAEVAIALSVFDEALADPKAGYHYALAEQEGMVVGYACWGRDPQTRSSYELYWIAVDSRCRSAGVGSLLLASVEAYVVEHGHGQLYIETAGRQQYEPTRSFYEHKGYVQAAWLADYFAPGDARVIYTKRL